MRVDSEAAKFRPNLKIGDSVCGAIYGSNSVDREKGAFAEYLRALVDLVLKIPEKMRMEEAATLGFALAADCLTGSLWVWRYARTSLETSLIMR